MAKLAQLSVRVDEYEVIPDRFQGLGMEIESVAVERAVEAFRQEVSVEVNVEGGSLRVIITVAGALLFTYEFIANYKGFKEGVVEICDDSAKYLTDVCGGVLQVIGVGEQSAKVYKRTMTPGRLLRLIDRLEKLHASKQSLNSREYRQQMMSITRELKAIAAEFSPQEAEILNTMVGPMIALPAPGGDGTGGVAVQPVALRPDEEDFDIKPVRDSFRSVSKKPRKKFKYRKVVKVNQGTSKTGALTGGQQGKGAPPLATGGS